jgi:SAM-dependent methyltransferase
MKEDEIRPGDVWEHFSRLVREDINKLFAGCEKENIACPACSSKNSEPCFEKNGFVYAECVECGTVFLNPRPLSRYFDLFYRESESVKFWSTDFYPGVEERRREKIYAPRASLIKDKIVSSGCRDVRLVDIGSGYGTFLQEVKRCGLDEAPVGIEPNSMLAEQCRGRGFEVIESMLEDCAGSENRFTAAVAFEVLDHVFNPAFFVRKAGELLKPGGVALFTLASSGGYDFKLLGKDHDTVIPPHHINFFNTGSVAVLMKNNGFSRIEVETPGRLDVDILCNRVEKFPRLLEDTLFRAIYEGGEKLRAAFQNFLVENKLSSHMWVWAEK